MTENNPEGQKIGNSYFIVGKYLAGGEYLPKNT